MDPASGPQTVSPFPCPPEYAKSYTQENIRNGAYLQPPPIPTRFTVFNEEYDLDGPLLSSLTDVGIQQLYSSSMNWKSEVKKLNRSIVAAFLDLIEILIQSPEHSERVEKIETIRLLFINIHHLINEYRPIQARDSLRVMVIRQNKEIKECTENLEKVIGGGNEAIQNFYNVMRNMQIEEACVRVRPSTTNPSTAGSSSVQAS